LQHVSDALPMATLALIDSVRDDDRPPAQRLRALRILERSPPKHRGDIARHLPPALSAPPDIAASVHLALLVLDKGLAVGRDKDGRFVAAEKPFKQCTTDGHGAAHD